MQRSTLWVWGENPPLSAEALRVHNASMIASVAGGGTQFGVVGLVGAVVALAAVLCKSRPPVIVPNGVITLV